MNTSPTWTEAKSLEGESDKRNITLLKPLKKTYGIELKPLNVIYCSRVGFGVLAALICVLLRVDKYPHPLITGISIILIVYIATYYVLKWRFIAKVEKLSKIFTMGIGAYFLTCIVFWTMFITPLLKPPIAEFTYSPQNPIVGEAITFDATDSDDPDGKIAKYSWYFGDETTDQGEIITHTYTSPANYTVTLIVKDNQGLTNKTETILTVSLNVTSP